MRCEVLSLSSHHAKGQHGCDKLVLAFIDGCKWTGNFLTDNREKQAVSVITCSLVRLDALFFAFCVNRCRSAGYGRKLRSGNAVFVSRFAIDALSSLNKCLVVSRSVLLRGTIRHLSCRDRAFVVSREVLGHGKIGSSTCVCRAELAVPPPVSPVSGTSIFQNIHDKSSACQDVQDDATIYQFGQRTCQVFIGHCVNLSYWSQARNGLAHPLLKVRRTLGSCNIFSRITK